MIPRTGIRVSKKELLGLLFVFIVYVLMGGVVFMLLESPLEEQLRRELAELRDEFQEKLDRMGTNSNLTRVDVERLMLRLASAHSNNLIDEEGNDTHTNWSFDNSFFFAITVVTTIGYGHLSPSTTPGRIFCVVYATLGIPLTGILLAAIGGHYSQHLVRRLQEARKSRHSRLSIVVSASSCLIPWLLVFLVFPAGLFTFTEGWSFVEGFYYCFITLSTIGFGDYVAGNFKEKYIWLYKLAVLLWIIFGLGYLAMILNYISRAMRCKQVRKVERKLSSSFYHTQQRVGQRLEEVCHVLQDISRHRVPKPRNRALKRIQSFPAPELSDKNHNHEIQKLLDLMEQITTEEQPQRPRRHSLPLPDSHHVHPSSQSRGSLQHFSLIKDPKVFMNGLHSKPPPLIRTPYPIPWKQMNVEHTLLSGSRNISQSSLRSFRGLKVSVIDVGGDTQPQLDNVSTCASVIDLEDLQCTRV